MANQVLTQDEINSLLRGLSGNEVEDGDIEQEQQRTDARRFDLANQ